MTPGLVAGQRQAGGDPGERGQQYQDVVVVRRQLVQHVGDFAAIAVALLQREIPGLEMQDLPGQPSEHAWLEGLPPRDGIGGDIG
jgi:hypothetical protein